MLKCTAPMPNRGGLLDPAAARARMESVAGCSSQTGAKNQLAGGLCEEQQGRQRQPRPAGQYENGGSFKTAWKPKDLAPGTGFEGKLPHPVGRYCFGWSRDLPDETSFSLVEGTHLRLRSKQHGQHHAENFFGRSISRSEQILLVPDLFIRPSYLISPAFTFPKILLGSSMCAPRVPSTTCVVFRSPATLQSM